VSAQDPYFISHGIHSHGFFDCHTTRIDKNPEYPEMKHTDIDTHHRKLLAKTHHAVLSGSLTNQPLKGVMCLSSKNPDMPNDLNDMSVMADHSMISRCLME